jgi:non-ribosomal peptide synthetase component E (peptide arylation enzyme)
MLVIPEGIVTHPAEVVAEFQRRAYWGSLSIGEAFHRAAARFRDRTALVVDDRRLTYGEVDEASDRFGAALLACGLAPGDRLIFQMGNVPETAIAFYGAVKAGLVPVCTLPAHRRREIDHFVTRTGALGHIVQADYRTAELADFAVATRALNPSLRVSIVARGRAEGCQSMADMIDQFDAASARSILEAAPIDSRSLGVLQLSGGSTAVPKVIPRFHADYLYNAQCIADVSGWDDSTVAMRRVVLMHNAGLVTLMLPCHLVGATVVLSALGPLRDDLAAMASQRVTFGGLGGPTARDVVALQSEWRFDLTALEYYLLSGAQVPAETVAAVERTLECKVLQQFGMGEGLCIQSRPDDPEWVRWQTVGAPLSAADEVRIIEPTSRADVALGAVGELACRGPYTIRGYFNEPAAARAFTEDGHYLTGDLARAHAVDGRTVYAIEGRIKDVINRGGEKISPAEIEALLAEHPCVSEVVAVAMPDRALGERTCVYVVPKEHLASPSLADLTSYLFDAGLAKYKLPERLEVVQSLPLTNVGKIDRTALRADIARRIAAASC